jgi:hypothetical protein
MNADLQHLYAHHAVGLCPEERCVAARANLAALVEAAQAFIDDWEGMMDPGDDNIDALRAALQGRVASREGSGT